LIGRKPSAGSRGIVAQGIGATGSTLMMDILMMALAFGFFALAIGYTYACERL
jgi:preprotein translocase subunit SecG